MAIEIMENSSEIYEMRLHETRNIDNWTYVLRVHYGWIYQFTCPVDEGNSYALFVPGPAAPPEGGDDD